MTSSAPPDASPGRPRRRWSLLAVALAGLALFGAAVVVARQQRGRDPVADAIAIAGSEDGYGTGMEAGRTLARTASALNDAIRTCDRAEEPERCSALGAASGYVQVAAATVVRCTAPGRAEARRSVRAVLEDLRTIESGDPAPTIPPIPSCRGG